MKRNTLNKSVYSSNIPNSDGFKTHRYNHYIWIFCGLAILFSCKAKKLATVNKATPGSAAVKPVDTKALKLGAVRSAQTNFSTFSGKARTKLDIGGNSNDVTLNIRINRDQKIWVSVTAIAGIEVARALITPDSILLINRLQSLYVRKPFSYIHSFTGEHVNYKTLESLLVGNAIPELINEDTNFKVSNDSTVLTGNLQGLIYKLLTAPNLKITQTNLDNQSAGQSLQVNNSAFIQSGNRIIPSQIDMASVVKSKKIQVNLHYIKIDFDQPLEYPFTIPSRYAPAN